MGRTPIHDDMVIRGLCDRLYGVLMEMFYIAGQEDLAYRHEKARKEFSGILTSLLDYVLSCIFRSGHVHGPGQNNRE